MKTAWNFLKRHWIVLLVVLLVMPMLLIGAQTRYRAWVASLPVVGPILGGLPQIGA